MNEALRITCSIAEHIRNSCSEFHQAPVVRQVTTSGLGNEQGEEEEHLGRGAGRGGRVNNRGARGGSGPGGRGGHTWAKQGLVHKCW